MFVDLFARDQNAPANLLSLYNAIHGTNLSLETTTVEPQFLEQVLYLGYYNDVAAIIGGKILVLIEHQSTLNENMPLRREPTRQSHTPQHSPRLCCGTLPPVKPLVLFANNRICSELTFLAFCREFR